jgi:hypothetical protein
VTISCIIIVSSNNRDVQTSLVTHQEEIALDAPVVANRVTKPSAKPTMKPTKAPSFRPTIKPSTAPSKAPVTTTTASPSFRKQQSSAPANKNLNNRYCGASYGSAFACAVACPLGTDAECPSGQFCYGDITCSVTSTAPVSSPSVIPNPNSRYCGASYGSANACSVACPGGTNGECPSGQFCFGSIVCAAFTPKPVSSPSALPPTPPASNVGYYMWTYTQNPSYQTPVGTTLSIAFSGWTSVTKALAESNPLLPYLKGTKFISFGGGNENVSLLLLFLRGMLLNIMFLLIIICLFIFVVIRAISQQLH